MTTAHPPQADIDTAPARLRPPPDPPPSTATVVYPLIAALFYAFGALLLKRSSDLGIGLWRTTFVANLSVASLLSLL